MVVAMGWEGGSREFVLNGDTVLVLQSEEFEGGWWLHNYVSALKCAHKHGFCLLPQLNKKKCIVTFRE